MTPGEVRRLYFIIRTFLSYGLDELIPPNASYTTTPVMALFAVLDAKPA
ncbi:ubiquinone biosynthesis protein [Salmonella enterica subsp. salamae]|nr:ubiquinone biosynthesis protein [Salmonella enterica subsp. salamae]